MNDIVERERLDLEVERLKRELAVAMNRASMAEVATGTLHNVGNVLTSISVSTAMLGKHMRESRVPNLVKALGLLRDNQANLSAFLTNDSKGKMLPAYLETLADHLSAEHEDMLREMESLNRNLDHIKEIVTMQQSYARSCGVVETLQVSELVQDAIRMNLGAFERHGVKIECDFADVPPVAVDRHKVLQILINLLRNAKYAADELAPPEKKICVSISSNEQGKVLVSVRDNGVGICAENLSRIFNHGFTTKRDGHGFGLHSGAQAARELGGRLTAASEGPGKGATFCLELPAASPQANNQNGNRNNHIAEQR